MSQLAQLPKDKLRREVGPRCPFEAGSVYIVHLLALVFPRLDIRLVWVDPYPLVPAAADAKETYRLSYTPRSIPIKPPKARPLVFSLILAYTCQVLHGIPLRTNSFRVFCRGREAFHVLDGSDVASANVQDSGNAFGPIAVATGTLRRRYACCGGCRVGGRVWAAKRHVSTAYDEACTHNK